MASRLRRWWPLALLFVGVVLVQVWWTSTYDLPGGHASDHFLSATAIFGIGFATAALVWALPAAERRQPVLWVLATLIVGAALAVTIGNLWVVDAIGTNNWTNEQADALGAAIPRFAAGHELAERAGVVLAGGTVAIAGWLWWRGAVSRVAAIVALPLSLVAGLGVFVLAIDTVVRRARSNPSDETTFAVT